MKTTAKDFEAFKRYCDEALEKLGLVEWAVYYYHEDTQGCYASTAWKLSDMAASIPLCTEWDEARPKNDDEIRKLAYHEVMHILMAPLIAEAEDRYANETAILIAEHAIIRRLERIV